MDGSMIQRERCYGAFVDGRVAHSLAFLSGTYTHRRAVTVFHNWASY